METGHLPSSAALARSVPSRDQVLPVKSNKGLDEPELLGYIDCDVPGRVVRVKRGISRAAGAIPGLDESGAIKLSAVIDVILCVLHHPGLDSNLAHCRRHVSLISDQPLRVKTKVCEVR